MRDDVAVAAGLFWGAVTNHDGVSIRPLHPSSVLRCPHIHNGRTSTRQNGPPTRHRVLVGDPHCRRHYKRRAVCVEGRPVHRLIARPGSSAAVAEARLMAYEYFAGA